MKQPFLHTYSFWVSALQTSHLY